MKKVMHLKKVIPITTYIMRNTRCLYSKHEYLNLKCPQV